MCVRDLRCQIRRLDEHDEGSLARGCGLEPGTAGQGLGGEQRPKALVIHAEAAALPWAPSVADAGDGRLEAW